MKKKLLSFIVFCLMIPCMFLMSACNKQNLTNAEISAICKNVAIKTWDNLGLSDPTTSIEGTTSIGFTPADTTFSSNNVPNKRISVEDPSELLNVKFNQVSMAGIVYMVSQLYANESYVTVNNSAIFDVNISIGNTPFSQNYILKTIIDKENNKLFLEAIITVMGSEQYSNVEINYNFDANRLINFRYFTKTEERYIDMSARYYDYDFYSTDDTTDTFASSVEQCITNFKNETARLVKLENDYSEEIQSYMNVLNTAISEFHNSMQ